LQGGEEQKVRLFITAGKVILITGWLFNAIYPQGSGTNSINLEGIRTPFHFGRIQLTPDSILWTVGGDGFIGKTSPHGRKIQRVGADVDLNAIYFVSRDRGWVVGDSGQILHSEDGGDSWQLQRNPAQADLSALHCPVIDTCWVAGDEGTLLRTIDSGRTWLKVNSPTTKNLHSVYFLSQGIGWVAGEGGTILHTRDAGATWIENRVAIRFAKGTPSPFDFSMDIVFVKFENANLGWLAASSGVASTTDGGKSWTISYFPDSGVIGLVVVNRSTLIAVGQGGLNWFSSDGGRTWDSNSIPSPSGESYDNRTGNRHSS
jgi:photosystem II stability/assembly factor-like uncharacterized protein